MDFKINQTQYHKYIIPNNYKSSTNKLDLQNMIYDVLYIFETVFKMTLNLYKIRSPTFIKSDTDLNDSLSGEIPAKFTDKSNNSFELIHSLAKWKRYQLKELNLNDYEGIVTNMKAIRREEFYDNIHSLFVDQWDWEIKINETDRNLNFLMETVTKIYNSIYFTAELLNEKYGILNNIPKQIHFITTEELYKLYPNDTPKNREHKITRKYKSVCLIGIGDKLSNGYLHDNRAVDYDDWSTEIDFNNIKTNGLNCDILLYNEILDESLEICSMGIRVNSDVLKRQYDKRHLIINTDNEHDYTKKILNNELPQSIGGGIGQSRLLLFFLKKCHIGEVQVSQWPNKDWLINNGVNVL
jgi:aspartate--ammonia ligase